MTQNKLESISTELRRLGCTTHMRSVNNPTTGAGDIICWEIPRGESDIPCFGHRGPRSIAMCPLGLDEEELIKLFAAANNKKR